MNTYKFTTGCILLLLFLTAFGQEKKSIKVIVPNKTDQVFITGNQESLGNWNPSRVKLDRISDYERGLTLDLDYPAEFKFTKGSWDSEGIVGSVDGNPNLKLQNQASKSIFYIKGWSNDDSIQQSSTNYFIKKIKSKYLQDERQLKISLPKNYNPNSKYPVFYITDGGWNLFKVAQNELANLSLKEYGLAPECIVVGIVHGQTSGSSNRNKDLDVYYEQSGKNFKNFIFKELVPYIDKTYGISGFNVIIGHSNGAEYNHFLLLEKDNPFRGFISLSTNFYIKNVGKEMGQLFKSYTGEKMYYFVANATQDSPDRIKAGDKYEVIYHENQNRKFDFSKRTYTANHNSIVPLAITDAILHVFKDYRNFDNYKDFTTYKNRYSYDMKANYGINVNHSLNDLSNVVQNIFNEKNVIELEAYFDFVESQKLWQNSAMNEPGGFDSANKGNMFNVIEAYEKSADEYSSAFDQLNISVEPAVFYYNHEKIVESFEKTNRFSQLISLLIKSKDLLLGERDLLPRNQDVILLALNYQIARFSIENGLYPKEGKQALKYCTNNYTENEYFSKESLMKLRY